MLAFPVNTLFAKDEEENLEHAIKLVEEERTALEFEVEKIKQIKNELDIQLREAHNNESIYIQQIDTLQKEKENILAQSKGLYKTIDVTCEQLKDALNALSEATEQKISTEEELKELKLSTQVLEEQSELEAINLKKQLEANSLKIKNLQDSIEENSTTIKNLQQKELDLNTKLESGLNKIQQLEEQLSKKKIKYQNMKKAVTAGIRKLSAITSASLSPTVTELHTAFQESNNSFKDLLNKQSGGLDQLKKLSDNPVSSEISSIDSQLKTKNAETKNRLEALKSRLNKSSNESNSPSQTAPNACATKIKILKEALNKLENQCSDTVGQSQN